MLLWSYKLYTWMSSQINLCSLVPDEEDYKPYVNLQHLKVGFMAVRFGSPY